MASITDRLPACDIEYLSRGKRVTKHFEDAHLAKRFYVAKLNDGKEPKVVGQATPADWVAADEETAELNAAVEAAQSGDVGPATLSVPQSPTPPARGRSAATRAQIAGRIWARHGLGAQETQNLAAELDAEFGVANPIESAIHIRNSRKAITSFLESLGLPIPDATANATAGDAAS